LAQQGELFPPGQEPEFAKRAEDDPTFPQRVYRLVRLIPPGKVTTYGTIAAVLGERRAARMVGWAMSNCPPDISEIAHRVVNRYGELSGGWAWGHPDAMKQLLLDEGVTFVDEYQVDLSKHLWMPPMEDDLPPLVDEDDEEDIT
jgi:methylated-DNA-protein-cysteine methyltransferase-like protein